MGTARAIEEAILTLRGERVILDRDLAEIYGVSTKALNQAVKRNADRFPSDFVFQLAAAEAAALRSQIVTSNAGELTDGRTPLLSRRQHRSQFVTGSGVHQQARGG